MTTRKFESDYSKLKKKS